jgi:hypothetical protein
MQYLKLFISVVISLVMCNCASNSNKYSVEIRHFAGAAGLTIYCTIDEEFIKVDTDCDFENCKRKNVYTRSLTPGQSDSLFQSLKALQLDTLRTSYKPEGMIFDGLVSSIRIRGSGLPNKEISIDNVDLPATDSLYTIVDRLILVKMYKFYHFGQE